MLTVLAVTAPGLCAAQVAEAPPSIVVQSAPWSSLSYEAPVHSGHEQSARGSVMSNTGWRTAIFAATGGVLAAAITSATRDEDGFKSAELTAFVVGAATGAIASLLVWPWLFGKH